MKRLIDCTTSSTSRKVLLKKNLRTLLLESRSFRRISVRKKMEFVNSTLREKKTIEPSYLQDFSRVIQGVNLIFQEMLNQAGPVKRALSNELLVDQNSPPISQVMESSPITFPSSNSMSSIHSNQTIEVESATNNSKQPPGVPVEMTSSSSSQFISINQNLTETEEYQQVFFYIQVN